MFRVAVLVLGLFFGLVAVSFGRELPGGEWLPEARFPELDDLLRHSLDLSPRMVEARLAEAEARAESEVRQAGLYPDLEAHARFVSRMEDRSDFDGVRSSHQPQAGLTLRQPVYHWGALRANSRIGRIRIEIAENDRTEAYRLLALEIRSRFLDVLLLRKRIELAVEELGLAEEELRAAELMVSREEIAAIEAREARLGVDEAALRLQRLREESRRAEEELLRIGGLGPSEDGDRFSGNLVRHMDESGEPETFPSVWGSIQAGIHPELDTAEKRVREAESRREIERARRRPNLNLVLGLTQDQVAVAGRRDIDRTVLFAGLEVRWNIFDGFETRGRQAAASARKQLAESRLLRQRREKEVALDRLEGELRIAARRAGIANERMVLAAERLERANEALERGEISETERARARVAYLESELVAAEGRAAYMMAYIEWLSESGRDPAMKLL